MRLAGALLGSLPPLLLLGLSCIAAPVQANQVRGWFSESSSFKGSVVGSGNKSHGDSMKINLLHQCYADPGSCRLGGYPEGSFEPVKNFWRVGNTDATDPIFDIENFKATGGKPDLYLLGDWDKYFEESDGDVVEVLGRVTEFKSLLVQNTLFSGVEVNCVGDGCIELKAANPSGVSIEFRNSESNLGNTKDFYVKLVNPATIQEIGGGEEAPGGSSCFKEDGTGVKVPEAKTCATDDQKFSGEYTSLKVEDDGTLILGGNLILEEDFIEFEAQNNARVEGLGGLVKIGEQTTTLKGNGTFAYGGPTVVLQ